MITSSQLERLGACPASSTLARHPHQGPAAVQGVENHARAEAGHLPPAIRAFVDGLEDVRWEQSYVLDTTTRRVWPVTERRGYGQLRWDDIGTTPDILARGVALDLKSRKRVAAAARNWQVKTHAVVAAALTPGRVRAGLGYLDNGELDVAEWGPIEIAAAWADLSDLCKRVAAVQGRESPVYTRGEHCEHCPGLLVCPSQRTAIQAFSPAVLEQLTDERVGEIHAQLKTFETMLEQAKSAIRARAEAQPIQLPSGKVLRVIDCERKSDDVYLIKERLRELGEDPEKFKKAVKYKQLKECKS